MDGYNLMILFQEKLDGILIISSLKALVVVSPSWTKMYLCKCMLHTLTGIHNLLFSKTADYGYKEGQNVFRAHCK